MQNYKRRPFSFNSPAILSLALVSFLILCAGALSGGSASLFFAVRFSAWSDPLMYLRLFTHVLAHESLSHYTANFLLILAVGPLAEEKYGSGRLLFMFAVCAAATGLINILFFPRIMLLGASGLVFMLILLASFTNMRKGQLPVTFLLVALLYLGNEIVAGLFTQDSVSRLSHILGGVCGAAFGYCFNAK